MSRIGSTAEKIDAVGRIYRAVVAELDAAIDARDPGVQIALLDVALTIAMSTDTHDMGLIGLLPEAPHAEY